MAFIATIIFFGGIQIAVSADSPEDHLLSFLKNDFLGDGYNREGAILYSDGKGDIVGDCGCQSPREAFDVRDSRLVIVSEWKILRTRQVSSNNSIVDVRFHVLATTSETAARFTVGKLRRIMPTGKSRDEVVSYRVLRQKGEWVLVDPPLPRVGVPPILAAFRKERSLEGDLKQKALDEGDRDTVRLRDGFIDYYQSQLSILESLEGR